MTNQRELKPHQILVRTRLSRCSHFIVPASHLNASVRTGLTWAFLGVLLFSFSVPMTKIAVGGVSPVLTAMGRAVIAGVLACILLAIRRVKLPDRQYLRPLLFTMFGAVFGWPILIALALERTTSAHVAVIAAFMPLTTALFAVLRTHEKVAPSFWWAAITGTVALIVFAITEQPVAQIFLAVLLGKMIKYFLLAMLAALFPARFRAFLDVIEPADGMAARRGWS